ncbi:SepM family pheromone-processing serine protease [Weissella kandleri]|uniref:SepM family pheromone-processing serine protease n=1 Tax=Weissella kandleri TaxID=1616 RepID=UPI00387EB551
MHNPKKKTVKKLLWWLLGLFLAAFVLVPLPLYSEEPGLSMGLRNFIKINQKVPDIHGDYNITAVRIQRVTGLTAMMAAFNPHADLISEQAMTAGNTTAEQNRLGQIEMQTALDSAKVVALKKAQQPYQENFKGVYVYSIQDDSNFKKQLQVGDMITAVNGEHPKNVLALQKMIEAHPAGTQTDITYQRNHKEYQAQAKTVQLDQMSEKVAGLGIRLIDHTTVSSPVKISADMGRIGGPSGGLMLALELYDALTQEDLAKGRSIAGTGTIDREGHVGEIGGIDKKVIAAHKSGAQIFFAPYINLPKKYLKYEEKHQTNYQLAKSTGRKYAPEMKIVPVKNFQDAIDYLEAHPN